MSQNIAMIIKQAFFASLDQTFLMSKNLFKIKAKATASIFRDTEYKLFRYGRCRA